MDPFQPIDPDEHPPEDAKHGALDLNKSTDRKMLERALREGWAVRPRRKGAYLAALDALVRYHADPDNPARLAEKEGVAAILGANRILQMEQATAVKDLHHQDKMDLYAAKKLPSAPTGEGGVEGGDKGDLDYDLVRARIERTRSTASN